MQMINLPRLRIAQLQTLTEGITQIVKNLGEVAPQVQEVNIAFTNFKEGMIKNASASDKKTLDRTRDQLNSGFFKSVKCEALYPHEARHKATVAKVQAITNKYDYDLNRKTYDEQTAETDNMIKELNAIDLNALPAVARWITPMKTANDNFKSTVKSYIQDQTEASDTTAAFIAAIPLEDALKTLFTMLYAHNLISKTGELNNAYKELEILVNSYR